MKSLTSCLSKFTLLGLLIAGTAFSYWQINDRFFYDHAIHTVSPVSLASANWMSQLPEIWRMPTAWDRNDGDTEKEHPINGWVEERKASGLVAAIISEENYNIIVARVWYPNDFGASVKFLIIEFDSNREADTFWNLHSPTELWKPANERLFGHSSPDHLPFVHNITRHYHAIEVGEYHQVYLSQVRNHIVVIETNQPKTAKLQPEFFLEDFVTPLMTLFFETVNSTG